MASRNLKSFLLKMQKKNWFFYIPLLFQEGQPTWTTGEVIRLQPAMQVQQTAQLLSQNHSPQDCSETSPLPLSQDEFLTHYWSGNFKINFN